jgi:uncharacterized damage-inducible protein DinB
MTPPGPPLLQSDTGLPSLKHHFLAVFEREHATTMSVLRAYPRDQLDFRPHPLSRSARELGWVFAIEAMLGVMVFTDEFATQAGGSSPPVPESWEEVLAKVESAHADFGTLIRETPEADLLQRVRFFTAPRTLGETTRLDWIWFILHDSIHHRGQFSIYLRMAGGRVPSIYGPTADESWT